MRTKRLSDILLFILALLAADLGLAQLGRLLLPEWDLRAHRQKIRISDPIYHHDLRPNSEMIDSWGPLGYRLITNSLGGRDFTSRDIPLKAAKPRVAVIGDSFIEGVGYPYERTLAGALNKNLEAAGTDFLNLGVSSYSPVIYYKKIETLAAKGLFFDDLFVFVDPGDIFNEALWYSLAPDGAHVSAQFTDAANVRKPRPVMDWFSVNSLTGKAVITISDTIRAKKRNVKLADGKRVGAHANWAIVADQKDARYTFDDQAWESWGARGMQSALDNLSRLKQITDKMGARLHVAAYPWPAQILHKQRQSRHNAALRQWCAENSIDFLDLYAPFFEDEDAESVLDAYYIEGDVHWNDAGHALMAKAFLQGIGLEPQADGIK